MATLLPWYHGICIYVYDYRMIPKEMTPVYKRRILNEIKTLENIKGEDDNPN